MDDLQFAVKFARYAGTCIVDYRRTTRRWKKPDGSDVSEVDVGLNEDFIKAVHRRERGAASVRGEERSKAGSKGRIWIIDPVDGTREYLTDGIPDHQRTTCAGIALLINGKLALSVVNNPFRQQLFMATADGPALMNNQPLRCSTYMVRRGDPYDYLHTRGDGFELHRLQAVLGKPIGCYSAIYQSCMVAMGLSCFSASPWKTLHDIAPGALLVKRAGGRVTNLRGRPLLDWQRLEGGVLFSSKASQAPALHAIARL